jgi:bd-type cytochrome oxidase subunit I
MKVLLDRRQFGVTITYHFLFVPRTIGLAFLVAIMQVLAYRRRDEVWERLTRFFGTLFLINFAMGVVTGIVQEFQFGMNRSNYSVFVGNIFGAQLAMEGLLAFFAESTFIALWMFGRNRLPPLGAHAVHLRREPRHDRVRVLHPHRQRGHHRCRDSARPQPAGVHVNVPGYVNIFRGHHAAPPDRLGETPYPRLAGSVGR